MRLRGLGIALSVSVFVGCAGAKPISAPVLTSSHRAAIRDSVSQMVAAWRDAVVSLDTARLGAFYATDSTFRWIEDGRVRYSAAGELLAAWRATVPGVRAMELLLDQTDVVPLAPGVAAVTTSFTQKVTDTAGRMGGFAGATSLIAVHTAQGWRFLIGHTSAAGRPALPSPR